MGPLGSSPRLSRKVSASAGHHLAWAQGAAAGFFAGAVLLTVITRGDDPDLPGRGPHQPLNNVEFLNRRRAFEPTASKSPPDNSLAGSGGSEAVSTLARPTQVMRKDSVSTQRTVVTRPSFVSVARSPQSIVRLFTAIE